MKLLIDANLSPRVVERLLHDGYEATHVGDHGLLAASYDRIAAFAVANNQVIVSADSDFTTLLALSGGTSPSLILMRSADALTPG